MFAKINTDDVREVPQTRQPRAQREAAIPRRAGQGRAEPGRRTAANGTVGDAAGWAPRMPPAPGREGPRDGPEGFIPSHPGP